MSLAATNPSLKGFPIPDSANAIPSRSAAWLDFSGLGLGGLQALRVAVIAAWVCCVIGLFGIYARLLTGLGVFYLHGVLVGVNSHSHNWYLATYTLVALASEKFLMGPEGLSEARYTTAVIELKEGEQVEVELEVPAKQ